MKPALGIIGTGKVGSTLARLWYQAGYPIAAIYNRTPDKAAIIRERIPSIAVVDSADAVVKVADVVFLTVADDAIAIVANQLAEMDWRGKLVVHTSGVASLDVLDGLLHQGAMIGSLHPVFPFAEVETAVRDLPGATFAIEAQEPLVQRRLMEFVESLNGQSLVIPAGKKALYHAALVFASNYTVTLYAVAEAILLSFGAKREVADNALNILLEATVKNIQTQGIPQALTGPLSRGDVGTIAAHLKAIDDEALRTLYIGLARHAYPMLQERSIDTTLIEKVLQD